MSTHVNIDRLREDHPSWTWYSKNGPKANDWTYHGSNGGSGGELVATVYKDGAAWMVDTKALIRGRFTIVGRPESYAEWTDYIRAREELAAEQEDD